MVNAGCEAFRYFPPDLVSNVINIRISLSATATDRLYESVSFGDGVSCWYREGGEVFPATIKVRGGTSRSYPKKSFTVEVEEPAGTVRYAFDASYMDPSALRNRLAFAAYREVGIAAPTTDGVGLFLNNSYLGYYTRIRMYDEETLKSELGGDVIEMFKCAFENMGQEIPIQSQTEKKIPDDDDFRSLNIMLVNMATMSESEWNNWVAAKFDVDLTARYLLIHNYLAVTDTESKNFNILVCDGRYSYLPWDNEASVRRTYFGDFHPSSSYGFAGDSILARRLLAVGSPVRASYDTLFDNLIRNDDTLEDQIRAAFISYYNQVAAAVQLDYRRYWDYQAFLDEYSLFMDFFDEREAEFP